MSEALLAVRPHKSSVDGADSSAPECELEPQVIEMLVHDLQNPLAGIMAFLEILKERHGGLTSTEHEGLEAAQSRCQELSELVLTLLQLGRSQRRELEANMEPIDLEHLARSAVDAFVPVAKRGRKELRFTAAETTGTVASTDERIVQRILYNLTRNALRHTPPGTTVELAVETVPTLQIVVQDDGPGIPRAIQHRVFEPGALRRAGVPSDSGIGLAFCRKAAESLGMSLRFEDRPEGGSRFILQASEAQDNIHPVPPSFHRKPTLQEVSA